MPTTICSVATLTNYIDNTSDDIRIGGPECKPWQSADIIVEPKLGKETMNLIK